MKYVPFFILVASGGFVCAQTNSAPHKVEQQVEVDSDSGHFDGNTHQMFYLGNVLVTDHAKAWLQCQQLTVNLPSDGGHPTNIVAETQVIVDLIDGKGQTNHITADKAVYAYSVAGTVTNETVTFTGGKPSPKVENPQLIILGEPLVLDVPAKKFGGEHYQMIFKHVQNSVEGTNGSPFNFLK